MLKEFSMLSCDTKYVTVNTLCVCLGGPALRTSVCTRRMFGRIGVLFGLLFGELEPTAETRFSS